jgi:hypothetical protein
MIVAAKSCIVRPAGDRGDVLRFRPGDPIGRLPMRWIAAMVDRGEAYEVEEIQPPNDSSGEPSPDNSKGKVTKPKSRS